MLSEEETREYLLEAEHKAIVALSRQKWEVFGYWASQAVHLRRILGISNSRSPLMEFSNFAKYVLKIYKETEEIYGRHTH